MQLLRNIVGRFRSREGAHEGGAQEPSRQPESASQSDTSARQEPERLTSGISLGELFPGAGESFYNPTIRLNLPQRPTSTTHDYEPSSSELSSSQLPAPPNPPAVAAISPASNPIEPETSQGGEIVVVPPPSPRVDSPEPPLLSAPAPLPPLPGASTGTQLDPEMVLDAIRSRRELPMSLPVSLPASNRSTLENEVIKDAEFTVKSNPPATPLLEVRGSPPLLPYTAAESEGPRRLEAGPEIERPANSNPAPRSNFPANWDTGVSPEIREGLRRLVRGDVSRSAMGARQVSSPKDGGSNFNSANDLVVVDDALFEAVRSQGDSANHGKLTKLDRPKSVSEDLHELTRVAVASALEEAGLGYIVHNSPKPESSSLVPPRVTWSPSRDEKAVDRVVNSIVEDPGVYLQFLSEVNGPKTPPNTRISLADLHVDYDRVSGTAAQTRAVQLLAGRRHDEGGKDFLSPQIVKCRVVYSEAEGRFKLLPRKRAGKPVIEEISPDVDGMTVLAERHTPPGASREVFYVAKVKGLPREMLQRFARLAAEAARAREIKRDVESSLDAAGITEDQLAVILPKPPNHDEPRKSDKGAKKEEPEPSKV